MKSVDQAKATVQEQAAVVAEKTSEKVAEVISHIDEKDRKAMKEQALKAADIAQEKAAAVLKDTKAVLESPEASIVSKVAGKKA